MEGHLLRLLERKTGSRERADEAVAQLAEKLGFPLASAGELPAGLALCAMGVRPEAVAKHLSWKEFEGFSSAVLRARGFRVRENIYLKKPRAQIDVLGMSERLSIAVDCKHWARQPGHAVLSRLVDDQRKRAERLHESLDEVGPVVPVILLLADPGERFVAGGAVVPVYAFADFLDGIDAFSGSLEFS